MKLDDRKKKEIMEFSLLKQYRTEMERNGMGFVWTQSEATHIHILFK